MDLKDDLKQFNETMDILRKLVSLEGRRTYDDVRIAMDEGGKAKCAAAIEQILAEAQKDLVRAAGAWIGVASAVGAFVQDGQGQAEARAILAHSEGICKELTLLAMFVRMLEG